MSTPEVFEYRGMEQEPISHPKILLVNIPSEKSRSVYEPLGPEVILGAIEKNLPGQTETALLDVQIGQLEVEETVREIKLARPDVLGLSIPQGAWNYAEAVLTSLSKLHPLDEPRLTLLGNTVPTWAPPEMILNKFPQAVLVRGEGEEVAVSVVRHLINGTAWESEPNLTFRRDDGEIVVNPYKPPDLSNYALPDRQGLEAVLDRGGYIQIEGSRDCPWRRCKFCLKIKGGRYRVVPSEMTVKDLEVIDSKGGKRVGFADEDFFGNLEERQKLATEVSKRKRPIVFGVTSRVDSFIRAEEEGVLDALIEAGLVKVFLGPEGGCNPYLEDLKKGITLEQIERAIAIAEEKGLERELGIITCAHEMPFEWLKANIQFIEKHWRDISGVLNEMHVYYGSENKERLEEKGLLGHFDLNNLEYEGFYEDPRTRKVADYCREWRGEESGLYDALKSLARATLGPKTAREKEIVDYLVRFKELDFHLLKETAELVDQEAGKQEIGNVISGLEADRSKLVRELKERMERRDEEQIVDPRGRLYREVTAFLKREREPAACEVGVAAIIVRSRNGRVEILMEEKTNLPGKLEAPAGLRVKGEKDDRVTLTREMGEELGSRVEVGEPMPSIRIKDHYAGDTHFDELVLYPYKVTLGNGINLDLADGEVKKVLWVDIDRFDENIKAMGYEVDEEIVDYVERLKVA